MTEYRPKRTNGTYTTQKNANRPVRDMKETPIDNDLAWDNLENDFPAADLEDL